MANPKLHLKLAPERRLVMTFALRQALKILEMPQAELAEWLREEIEKNPLLEYTPSRNCPPNQPSYESLSIPASVSLYDHLLAQVRSNFPSALDRMIAEEILEHLDEKGFITGPLEPIAHFFEKPLSHIEAILKTLQTFDPPGICARSLQETFLLQLKASGEELSTPYLLVEKCFEDLLHSRYSSIKKKLGPIDLAEALKTLKRLHLRPSSLFKEESSPTALPDLQISKIQGGWTIELKEDELPKFYIQTEYLSLETSSAEEKEALQSFSTSAKWLFRSLSRRKNLLKQIGRVLVRKQSLYLNCQGPLSPISLRQLAEELEIHESTLSRAIAGKYAATPRGIIPIRSLICSDPDSNTVKESLASLIANEDKERPFTDDALSAKLNALGFLTARRTIAKYRKLLKIGTASQRKHLLRKRG